MLLPGGWEGGLCPKCSSRGGWEACLTLLISPLPGVVGGMFNTVIPSSMGVGGGVLTLLFPPPWGGWEAVQHC